MKPRVQASTRHQFPPRIRILVRFLLDQGCRVSATRTRWTLGDMLRGVETFQGDGSACRLPHWLSLVAETQPLRNELDGAQQQPKRRLPRKRGTSDHWWDAELHRLNAELLLRQGDSQRCGRPISGNRVSRSSSMLGVGAAKIVLTRYGRSQTIANGAQYPGDSLAAG